MPGNDQDKRLFRKVFEASTPGIQLVLCTFVGFAIGRFLDNLMGATPWLTIFFFLIGVVAGFRELIRIAKKQDGTRKDGR